MTSKIYDVTHSKIYNKLNSIAGVTTLDGWLQLYIDDFFKPQSEYTFPALFLEYAEDQNNFQSGSTVNKCNRSVAVVGAVSVGRSENVNAALDDLLFKLKIGLKSGDPITDKISMSKVTFEISEDRRYAMFKANVSIDIAEKME